MGSTRVYVKANNENDCTFQANHGHSMEPRRRESFMVLSKAPGAETGVGSIANRTDIKHGSGKGKLA